MFKVPILLVLYNRIEETHNLFQIISTVQPTELYVACDGPKRGDSLDRTRVYQTRAVIQPAWTCQQHNLWMEEHLGKSEMILKAMNDVNGTIKVVKLYTMEMENEDGKKSTSVWVAFEILADTTPEMADIVPRAIALLKGGRIAFLTRLEEIADN